MAYKQVIIIRQDLKLPKGKLASQVGHAVIDAAFGSKKSVVNKWKKEGMKKIVLKVKNLKELKPMMSPISSFFIKLYWSFPISSCLKYNWILPVPSIR